MSAQIKIQEAEHQNSVWTVANSFAYCEHLARTHYENFPVGSRLVSRSKRPHVYSIYAFARIADDFADEDDNTVKTADARLAALNDWGRQLEDCVRGRTRHPVFIALAETIQELELPVELFRDLLSAFKQDVVKRRYANFAEVLDYCTRSANPVGRLILRLFNYRDGRFDTLSDNICTALQLTNFWQDVSVDLEKDRIYFPQDEMAQFGVAESDLRARHFNQNYAALIKYQVGRTRELFARGRQLPELVRGRLRYELRLTWLGGMRILERIELFKYDTLTVRPKLTTCDKLRLLLKVFAS